MKKGFTLVELSIVLIIIGLIIGGVMKGKDLINSAEQKKVYNTWLKNWQITANTYQDRTGGILGDGTTNGGTTDPADGKMDGVDLNDTNQTVHNKLKTIGLEVPAGNVPATSGGSYRVKGKYVTSEAMLTLNADTSGKNILEITGLPTDVAIAFDGISDGELDPTKGTFKTTGVETTWPDANGTTTVNVSLEI